jgi:DNA-binding NtrC family response regulator
MAKILLVDDVPSYLASLSRFLSRHYQIVEASSLEEAKQRMDDTISLALVDVRLSETDIANRDGIVLLGWLREKYPNLPVIMMSAYRDWDSAIDALNLGAAHFLKRPFQLAELTNLITPLISNKD